MYLGSTGRSEALLLITAGQARLHFVTHGPTTTREAGAFSRYENGRDTAALSSFSEHNTPLNMLMSTSPYTRNTRDHHPLNALLARHGARDRRCNLLNG